MSEAYAAAGVNLEAGYETVRQIKGHLQRTRIPGVMGAIGGFGGLFDLSTYNYREPVLVSGTDGVGTKLKLAFALDKHDTVGIDLVAMCVNDIVAQGARPLYFLDYVATGKIIPERMERIVAGIADGCEQSGCALVGGESAEMPGMYSDGEYDLAGFAVGAVEKSQLISPQNTAAGQVVLGLPSSGVHSNGFSLVRKILNDTNTALTATAPQLPAGQTVGQALLEPTRIYVSQIQKLLAAVPVTGIAHITGGGFYENMPRCLAPGLGIEIRRGSWQIPPIFTVLAELGKLDESNLYNVFNMGIGMIALVEPTAVTAALDAVPEAQIIGTVTATTGVRLV